MRGGLAPRHFDCSARTSAPTSSPVTSDLPLVLLQINSAAVSYTMADLPTVRIGYVPGTSAFPQLPHQMQNSTPVSMLQPLSQRSLPVTSIALGQNIANTKPLSTRALPNPTPSRTPFPGCFFPPIQNRRNSLPIWDRPYDHIPPRQ